MESINPWTRIPNRASFDEAFSDPQGNAWSNTPEQQAPAAPEPELAPIAQDLAPPPAASGIAVWAGEPPPRIPFETLAPGDSDERPVGV